jgi:hypothetical protein
VIDTRAVFEHTDTLYRILTYLVRVQDKNLAELLRHHLLMLHWVLWLHLVCGETATEKVDRIYVMNPLIIALNVRGAAPDRSVHVTTHLSGIERGMAASIDSVSLADGREASPEGSLIVYDPESLFLDDLGA